MNKENTAKYAFITILLIILAFIAGNVLASAGVFEPFSSLVSNKKEDKKVNDNTKKEADKDTTKTDSSDNKKDEANSSKNKDDSIKEDSKKDNASKTQTGVSKKEGKNHIPEAQKYSYDTKTVRDNMENHDYDGEKLAFLTFDDGVNTVITPKVLKTLKEKEVHATFFIPGKTLYSPENNQVLKDMYQQGHAIAIHSNTHDYEKLYPGRRADVDRIEKEYKDALSAMKSVLGEEFDTKVWRYPGGHMSWKGLDKADERLASMGVEWIDWNSMTGDAQPKKVVKGDIPRPTSTEEVISNFDYSLNFTANGDQAVILMHDASDKELTAKSLDKLIDHLKEQGYKFGIMQ